jgi:hypothetical protein
VAQSGDQEPLESRGDTHRILHHTPTGCQCGVGSSRSREGKGHKGEVTKAGRKFTLPCPTLDFFLSFTYLFSQSISHLLYMLKVELWSPNT